MRALMMMLVPFAFSPALAENQPAGPVAAPPPAVTAPAPVTVPPVPPQATAAAPSSTPAPVAANASVPPPQPPARRKRITWEERFEQANLGQNGQLTLQEAKGGYPTIARNFQDIDTTNKGYVTKDDIRAWRAQQKAARNAAPRPDDPLRPRAAYLQSVSSSQNRVNASTTQTVATPRAEPAATPATGGATSAPSAAERAAGTGPEQDGE
ncbi:MAG: hypothetical protein JSS43_32675 [Proteobacteria bacterium]|nr:hypothetical protein [Pseudomonadota bacterium]